MAVRAFVEQQCAHVFQLNRSQSSNASGVGHNSYEVSLRGRDRAAPEAARGGETSASVGTGQLPRRPAGPLTPEVEPQNEKQEEYLAALRDTSVSSVICFGRTGTGKTHVAVAVALQWLRTPPHGQQRKIILLRPEDESMTRHPTQDDYDYCCALNKPALELVREIAFPTLSGHTACLERGPTPLSPCRPASALSRWRVHRRQARSGRPSARSSSTRTRLS